MVVQVIFFLTPVIYPGSLITGDWQYVYALNPMSSVIDGISMGALRHSRTRVSPRSRSRSRQRPLLLAFSLSYFQRTERFFADLV